MCRLSLLLTVLLLNPTGAAAQSADSAQSERSGSDTSLVAQFAESPVVFADDTLFIIYSPLGEFVPSERAAQITQRLRDLARNKRQLDSLRLVENEGVTDAVLDTLRVFSVTGHDASVLGLPRDSVAREYRQIVIEALRERRYELSFKALLTGLGISAGLLAVLLGLFWLMRRFFPWLYAKVDGWEGTLFRTIRFRSYEIIDAPTVTAIHLAALKGVRLLLSLFFVYVFLTIAFSLFPLTREWNLEPVFRGLLLTLLATVVTFGLWRFGAGFFERLSLKISEWKGTVIRGVRVRNFEVFSEERIVGLLQGATTLLRYAAGLILVYFYLTIILNFFEFSKTWARTLLGYVMDPVLEVLGSFIAFLPDLFFIVVIVAVTRFLLRVIRGFFEEISRGRLTFIGFHKDWAIPTYQIVRFLTIAFAAIIIFPYLPGSESPAFQGVSVFLGILFSLGSSSAIANMVAGVVITYMRPFQIGDRVKIADTVGDVVERNLLVTRVRTVKNVDVTIPNAMVLGSHIINYSSSAGAKGLILDTTVTIGYDVPWRTVHELLSQAALDTQDILPEPPPFVLQKSLDDFSVAYELNAYTTAASRMTGIYSDLHQHIQDRFNQAGVEIMSPTFAAVRDGNQVAIPQEYLPSSYSAPPFGVSLVENLLGVKAQGKRPAADKE